MIRVLFFLVLIFALGIGFSWLAERPGELVVTVAGVRYQVTLMVAAIAIVAIVAAVMVVWWVLKSIWNSPHTVRRYFRARKRDRGYQSLSTGMIAAGAGDAAMAHDMALQASKLLSSDQEPLLHLLQAQASLLDGDHDEARRKFESMLDDPETRVLALRGLYLEAERLKDHEAARHYAETAAEVAPQLTWATTATLEMKTATSDWDGALGVLERQKSAQRIDKEAYNRSRAVLLTAKAMAVVDGDSTTARSAALEASRLAPELTPATVTAAEALFRLNDLRKGSKLLEALWKKEPHPDIAETYVHARAGDSAVDRLKRAKRLQSIKQNHPESAMAVARAALDAGEFDLARESLDAVLRQRPTEGAYLLLADIEERQTGNQGRIRQWLAKAVRAPRDAAWTADGYVSETWAPLSPVTGRLDAFEWRVPVERLGPLLEDEPDAPETVLAAIPAAEAVAAVEPVADVAEPEPTPPEPVEDVPNEEPTSAPAEPAVEEDEPESEIESQSEEASEGAQQDDVEGKAEEETASEAEEVEQDESAAEPETKSEGNGQAEQVAEDTVAESAEEPETDQAEEEEVLVRRPPDDPGVDPDAEREPANQRFRLF